MVPEAGAPHTPFLLLTQDNCPRCERLQRMLEQPLRGKYASLITVIHRQRSPHVFAAFAHKYALKSTPVIIDLKCSRVLSKVESLEGVRMFLSAHATDCEKAF